MPVKGEHTPCACGDETCHSYIVIRTQYGDQVIIGIGEGIPPHVSHEIYLEPDTAQALAILLSEAAEDARAVQGAKT